MPSPAGSGPVAKGPTKNDSGITAIIVVRHDHHVTIMMICFVTSLTSRATCLSRGAGITGDWRA